MSFSLIASGYQEMANLEEGYLVPEKRSEVKAIKSMRRSWMFDFSKG